MSAGLNIYQRLHAVMGEIDYIQKEKKQGMRYSIVSHDKVTAAVRPLLHKHGVVYHIRDLVHGHDGNRTWTKITVAFVNVDDPEDVVFSDSFGYGVDDQDKGPGKAMSYAVKYALLKTLGLETGDEPDEVQDERANYKPEPEEAPISAARSKKAWEMLLPGLKAQKTCADLNRWWFDHAEEIKALSPSHRWLLFSEMIQTGIDKCDKQLGIDLFWSNHQPALNKLKKADQYAYEALEEYMVTKATRLIAPDATLEFTNAG